MSFTFSFSELIRLIFSELDLTKEVDSEELFRLLSLSARAFGETTVASLYRGDKVVA